MTIKLQENTKEQNYTQNLKRFLNVGDIDLKIFKKSFGILKGSIKKTPLNLQIEMRKEIEKDRCI